MARKRKTIAAKARRTYTIYVIELSRDCVAEPCALAPLYVGQTAHTPEHRFAQHKAGGRLAAGKPHRYGVRLRLDLMAGICPFTSPADGEKPGKARGGAVSRGRH